MLRILTVAVLVLLAPFARAHDGETLFNKVSLQAEVQREVPNDEMTVTLATEHQGDNPERLAERVNQDMAWALEQVERKKSVKAETRSYSTYPMYKDGLIRGWRARQELQLRSQEFAQLTELLGGLQDRLQIVQMGFGTTPETRRKHQNELISEAMEQFRERVAIIRKNMDDKDYRIVELNVNTSGFGYRPMAVADMAMSKMERSAPAVEGGTSEVTVTVSGSVQFY